MDKHIQWSPSSLPQKLKKSPHEIIANALKAIDTFNKSCPSGLSCTYYDDRKYGSPHKTHTILHSFMGQFPVSDDVPCCDEYRQAIKELIELPNWYWRWKAKRAINKKKLYYSLIGNDRELRRLFGVQDQKKLSIYTIKCDYSKFNLAPKKEKEK